MASTTYVKIIGGLGNQMFQYAFACALATTRNVVLDVSDFQHYSLHQGLELQKHFSLELSFSTPPRWMKWCQYKWLRRIIGRVLLCYERPESDVENILKHSQRYRYFNGYWQNEAYFHEVAETIEKTFQFNVDSLDPQNLAIIKLFSESSCVAIHVRRGDYVNHPTYANICDEHYLKRALEKINASGKTWVIFSDDMVWCREFFQGEKRVFVDWNRQDRSYVDMLLLSYAKDIIIANSSFSWWAAYLNPRKVNKNVMAPKRWVNGKAIAATPLASWERV